MKREVVLSCSVWVEGFQGWTIKELLNGYQEFLGFDQLSEIIGSFFTLSHVCTHYEYCNSSFEASAITGFHHSWVFCISMRNKRPCLLQRVGNLLEIWNHRGKAEGLDLNTENSAVEGRTKC